jgi:hypothetical protein
MHFFLLIVATGVAVWVAFAAARAISAAHFDHVLSSEAPTSEDVAAIQRSPRWARGGTPS